MRTSYFTVSSLAIFIALLPLTIEARNNNNPEGILSGSTVYKPSASLEVERDDNIFVEEESAESTTLILLSAGIETSTILSRKSEFTLNAEAKNGRFSGRSEESYTDTVLGASYIFEPNSKLNSFVSLSLTDGHEIQGLESLSTRQEIDDFTLNELSTGFEYGINALGSSVIEANFRTRSRKHKDSFKNKSRNEIILDGAIKFPLSPNLTTRISSTLKQFDYSSKTAPINRDSVEAQLFVGANWQATAISLIKAKIGYQAKNFKSNAIDNDSAASWEINYVWEPEDNTLVTLTTTKEFTESDTNNDINATHDRKRVTSLAWEQPWTDFFDTELSLGRITVDVVSTNNTDTDVRNYIALSGNYLFSKTITLKGGLIKSDYEFETSGFNTDSNTVFIRVDLAI